MSGGRALEMSSPACVDAQSGSSWMEVRFIGLSLIRDREAREGETHDDVLLRLASNSSPVRVRCASIRVWNPWLLAMWISIVITLDGSVPSARRTETFHPAWSMF